MIYTEGKTYTGTILDRRFKSLHIHGKLVIVAFLRAAFLVFVVKGGRSLLLLELSLLCFLFGYQSA